MNGTTNSDISDSKQQVLPKSTNTRDDIDKQMQVLIANLINVLKCLCFLYAMYAISIGRKNEDLNLYVRHVLSRILLGSIIAMLSHMLAVGMTSGKAKNGA